MISHKLLETSLHIPPRMWTEFRQTMLQARQKREEVIGFFFCQRQQLSQNKIKYVPQGWIVPSPECYEHQSTTGLVLKQSFHRYLLDTYLNQRSPKKLEKDCHNLDSWQNSDFWSNSELDDSIDQSKNCRDINYEPGTVLDVIHIHSHFGLETPYFSDTDDRHEAEYARFLASIEHPRNLISGVFDESLEKCQFRIWDCQGTYHTPVEFYNSWLAIDSNKSNYQIDPSASLMFARQRIFGERVQQQLGQLKVALIGCGGIGSVFAEQLARLGVKNWILIDRDRLETSNLNRMPGATTSMVDRYWHKVDYVKHLITQVYPADSNIKAIPTVIEEVQAEIADADLIVVATDNHHSRQIAQELALKYLLPLMCLGTHIEVKSDFTPRMYCRVTVPPLNGGWCLMCGNIINLQQAALEFAPQAIAHPTYQAGYIQGIDDPAVFWLNSICASTGVGIIHSMLCNFIDLDSGLDWIYDFPNSNWLKTNTEHLHTPECYFCSSPAFFD